jgi:hypothetical protein
MKKNLIILSALICSMIISCTAPTQPIANQAFKEGLNRQDKLVADLAALAKWEILNRYGRLAEQAAASTTQPAEVRGAEVKALVKDGMNAWEEVSWLEVQHERNRRVFMIADIYIKSQQGILNIWFKELSEAKAKVDSDNALKTSLKK